MAGLDLGKLAATAVFGWLRDVDLALVIEWLSVEHFERGEIIVRAGDPARHGRRPQRGEHCP